MGVAYMLPLYTVAIFFFFTDLIITDDELEFIKTLCGKSAIDTGEHTCMPFLTSAYEGFNQVKKCAGNTRLKFVKKIFSYDWMILDENPNRSQNKHTQQKQQQQQQKNTRRSVEHGTRALTALG